MAHAKSRIYRRFQNRLRFNRQWLSQKFRLYLAPEAFMAYPLFNEYTGRGSGLLQVLDEETGTINLVKRDQSPPPPSNGAFVPLLLPARSNGAFVPLTPPAPRSNGAFIARQPK